MKVLQAIASVDPRGGGPIQGIFSSAAIWAKHGHQVHIVSLDGPDAPWVRASPVPTFALGTGRGWRPVPRRFDPLLRYGYTPLLTRWFNDHARNYDIVVLNGLWNYMSYGAWRSLHRSAVPYFVFPHGMLDPWFNTAQPVKFIFKNAFWKLFERKVLRDARAVLFTTDEEQNLASQSFKPYAAHGLIAGYGAEDAAGDPAGQRAEFFAKAPGAKGRKLIVFLGRLHEKKGIDLLIRAFARHADELPAFDLLIAGPDQVGLQSRLMGLARDLNIAQRIYWPGMLTGSAKVGAFRAAEFFVLPSHQENFGVVVAEAMALSKPVLITNKVNIYRDVVADDAGLVVNDDVDAIARGLQRMCTLPQAERDALGRNARRCFATRYDFEQVALKQLQLMKSLIEEGAERTTPAGVGPEPLTEAAGARRTA